MDLRLTIQNITAVKFYFLNVCTNYDLAVLEIILDTSIDRVAIET